MTAFGQVSGKTAHRRGGALSTQTVPPPRSTICWTIDSPTPLVSWSSRLL
jgi:hypothetical protein